jgi:NAD(P)-dependent dehydrogenase (short-subunit alcohol dehydrogenase family)
VKTFLSIGSGPGMGYATAARFAREGFQIVLSARHLAKTQELANRLRAKGCRVDIRTVDAADPESVAALASAVQEQFGPIDVLHYNAASIRQATVAEQPKASFNQDLAVNVGGALAATQAVARQMSERGSGTILLTGGGFSLAPNAEYISLSIGKGGCPRDDTRHLRESQTARYPHRHGDSPYRCHTRLERGRSRRRTFLATLPPATGQLDSGGCVFRIELLPASPQCLFGAS